MNIYLYLTDRDYRVHRKAIKYLREKRNFEALGVGLVTIRRLLRNIKAKGGTCGRDNQHPTRSRH